MRDLSRRLVLSVAGAALLLSTYATVYRWGMATFEGEQLSYVRALQVVLEALTTAGFGGDAPWSSPEMNAMIIAMNLTGVLLVFFAIPFFLVPLLENAIQTEAPTETALTDHVVVCADSPRKAALRAELETVDVPELFVEQEADRTGDLVERGIDAIHGDPETAETLESANVGAAEALIVDIDDETNANVILTARRLNPDLRILSVVEDADAESYHCYAGADEVVRPRVAVGERLAGKAAGAQLRSAVDEVAGTHESITTAELLVESGSELVGETLSGSAFRQRFGVTVLGGWFHGEFVAPVDPDRRLPEHGVLLVAGETGKIEALDDRTAGLTTLAEASPFRKRCERVVVAGYGVVGRTVAETLAEDDVSVTVVDAVEKPGVDVVGDVTDHETLREAGVADADSVVLALSRDSLVVYASLVLAEHAPTVEVLARADDADYVENAYDAGASYTLSLSEVTVHMVTARLFDAQDTDGDGGYEIVRTEAPSLHGQSLETAAVRQETGAHILAVEREGTLYTNPGPSFELRRTDTVVLGGTGAALATFEQEYSEAGA